MTNHLKKLANSLYQTNNILAANKILNILKFAEDDFYSDLFGELTRVEDLYKTDPDRAKERIKELLPKVKSAIEDLRSRRSTDPESYSEQIGYFSDFLIDFGELEEGPEEESEDKFYQGWIRLKEGFSPRRKKYYLDSPKKKIDLKIDPDALHSLDEFKNKEVYLKGSMRADGLYVDPESIREVKYAPDDPEHPEYVPF